MILLIILAIQYNIYFNTDGIYKEVRQIVDKEHEIVSLENRKKHLDHERKELEDIAKERKRVGDHIRTRLQELVLRLETWKQEMWDISVGSKSKTLKPPLPPMLKLKDTERNALSFSVDDLDVSTEELRVWVKPSSKNDEEDEEEEEEDEEKKEENEVRVTRTLSSTQSREEKFPLGTLLLFVENLCVVSLTRMLLEHTGTTDEIIDEFLFEMRGCIQVKDDESILKTIRIDGLNSDTIYDIAIQGTNRAGDGTLSRAVTAQTKDYEKRPLVVGFLNRNAGSSYVGLHHIAQILRVSHS